MWTYAAGVHESSPGDFVGYNCPCSSTPGSGAPSFVGNYYCESGNPSSGWASQIYSSDKLWDGLYCEGSCCTGAGTPLFFSVQLNTVTMDDIEIRICGSEVISNEDTPVELIELYAAQ